jgi:acyl-CoA hydrolase
VTTLKNTVDKVVTEHGVAGAAGPDDPRPHHQPHAVADPAFRDALTAEARAMSFI